MCIGGLAWGGVQTLGWGGRGEWMQFLGQSFCQMINRSTRTAVPFHVVVVVGCCCVCFLGGGLGILPSP